MVFEKFSRLVGKQRLAEISLLLGFLDYKLKNSSDMHAAAESWAGGTIVKSLILAAIAFFVLFFVFSNVLMLSNFLASLAISLILAFLAYFLFFELFVFLLWGSFHRSVVIMQGSG